MQTRTITNTTDKIDVKVEGILNDLQTGVIQQAEAQQMLVSLTIDISITRLFNLCKEVSILREKQKFYFLTRQSKVLDECRLLEKQLDGKIKTFFDLEQKRQNPELTFENQPES